MSCSVQSATKTLLSGIIINRLLIIIFLFRIFNTVSPRKVEFQSFLRASLHSQEKKEDLGSVSEVYLD